MISLAWVAWKGILLLVLYGRYMLGYQLIKLVEMENFMFLSIYIVQFLVY